MGFGNYTKQAPQSGKTVPYVLRGLRNPDGSHPVLHVEHLGEENRPYWLEQLAKASAKARAGAQFNSSPTDLDRFNREQRDEAREDVIRHSARKVENAFHDDGQPATDKDIRAIVLALPDLDFQALFAFIGDGNRFRDYPIVENPAALAEKS